MGHSRFRLTPFLAICFALQAVSLAQGQASNHHDNPFLSQESTDRGWPNVRGPDWNGISQEIHLADSWPAEGPPVLWVKELGQGYSSLVVKNDRAYTQYQTLAGQFVICLDATSGETIWRFRYDWPFETAGLYPGPRSTPTIARDRIYFATPGGAVGCLNKQGSLIWRRELKQQFDGKGTDFGYACSPTIVENKVIQPVGGDGSSIVVLNASDGTVLWSAGDDSASYVPALPITVDGKRQVIGYLEHELAAFDLDTGELLWKQSLSRGYDEHSAWPIFHEPFLWTSSPFQAGSQLLKLHGGDAPGYERVWQSETMSNDVSSSVLVDGQIYGFDLAEAQSKAHRPSRGSFSCIDFMTGSTRWINGDPSKRRSTNYDENRSTQTVGHASVIAADGKLILFNDLGDLILAKADPHEYIELARTPALTGEICWTAPALDRGRLYLRNHSRAICVFLGEEVHSMTIDFEKSKRVRDIPRYEIHDISRLLGVEPEYAMDPPTWRWLLTWFGASFGILCTAGLLTFAIALAIRWRQSYRLRICFWLLAFMMGLFLGPWASIRNNDFVFTWPLSLFIVFQLVVYQSTNRRVNRRLRRSRWTDRIIALAFVSACICYFLLCRKLSLVTEWVFLCGFAAACPPILIGRSFARRSQCRLLVIEFALTLVAFSLFYWSSVLFLAMKYDLRTF